MRGGGGGGGGGGGKGSFLKNTIFGESMEEMKVVTNGQFGKERKAFKTTTKVDCREDVDEIALRAAPHPFTCLI